MIRALAEEDVHPTRNRVTDRLGGGSARRIDKILRDYRAASVEAAPPAAATGGDEPTPDDRDPSPPAPAPVQTTALVQTAAPPASPPPAPAQMALARASDDRIADLEAEIRVLGMLLESERKARRDDEARHQALVESLRNEITRSQRRSRPHDPAQRGFGDS